MVNLIIDDKKIQVPDGTTILVAAKANGIEIPTLCWDKRLTPFGGCRICLVEIEGRSKLYTSCSTAAENGMVVYTSTPDVLKARKTVFELLLVHHPLDCPICDKAGECKLQDMSYMYGSSSSNYAGEKKADPEDIANPLIDINTNRCIMCGRCVRVCWEHQGVGAINFIGRGFGTKVSPPFEETLNCEFCGQCVDACPVGALGSKPFRHRARAWFLEQKDNICPYCGVGCTITLDIREGRILNARGVDGKGVSKGDLCTKGRYGTDYIYSSNRLKTPMVRKNGELVPSSWEEAMYVIASGMKQVLTAHGPDSIGAIGSSRCSIEDNYVLQKFMRTVIGTNNIDSSAYFGYAKIFKAIETAFGLHELPIDFNSPLAKKVLLVLETDIAATHPIWGLKFIEARQHGAHLIVASARETKLTRHANTWLRIKPGTAQALVYGIMKTAIDEGIHLKNESAGNIANFSEMAGLLNDYTPDKVSELTGIGRDELIDTAARFLSAESRLVTTAATPASNLEGLNSLLAAANLVMLTGDGPRALQMPAEYSNTFGLWKMGVTPGYLPGYVKITDKPGKDLFNMLYEKDSIKALYLMGEDPLVTYPDLKKLEDKFQSLEFIVVQDIRMTASARYAHVVLPASSWSEKEGTFINMAGIYQDVNKIVASTGESMPDWQILRNLARVMNVPIGADSLKTIREEIDSIKVDLPHEKWKYAPVPFELAEKPDTKYPLVLVTGNLMQHSGALSAMSTSLTHVISDAFVQVSPQDADKYLLEDGGNAKVESKNGAATMKVRISEEIPAGMIFVPLHFFRWRVNELTSVTQGPGVPITTVRVIPQD
ncbi:molybdopterin-dependent oxidoreductase [Candidatus Magnetominusculus xianensis]|uniref:Formate dehydrogenase, alpha subunit n=1 Tax=Candidatus Magnetominusculus xianensis TaxID=1748249 RepID=A0ABR5SIY6_9BACT|nr:molybdopterin-dependent oxidoreductase [Candidatus Magnetominusculus xianensis]KWT92941.1 formate dehydrogenase, alpha subunit [Candidatus Magnetominusculus xianensis]MBF0402945.1 molybdopterin-dependent oxidoreductase [Nitrospirota bacterium]